MKGTVVRALAEKRFGFIQGTDGKQYFFHQSDYSGEWDDLAYDVGQNKKIVVSFEVASSMKGPRAAEVIRIDS